MPPGPQFSRACAGWPAVKVEKKNPHYIHVLGYRWSSADLLRLLTEAEKDSRPEVGALFLLLPLAFEPYLTYSHTTCVTFHCILIKSCGVESVHTDDRFCRRGRDADLGGAEVGEVGDFRSTIISKVSFFCVFVDPQLPIDVKKVVTGREEKQALCLIITDVILSCINCFLRQRKRPRRCLLCGWRELSSCWIAYGICLDVVCSLCCSEAQIPSKWTSIWAPRGRRRLAPCQEWDSLWGRGRFREAFPPSGFVTWLHSLSGQLDCLSLQILKNKNRSEILIHWWGNESP